MCSAMFSVVGRWAFFVKTRSDNIEVFVFNIVQLQFIFSFVLPQLRAKKIAFFSLIYFD